MLMGSFGEQPKNLDKLATYNASLKHHFDGFWRNVLGNTPRAVFFLYHNQYNNKGEYFTIVSNHWTKLGLDEQSASKERFPIHPNPCSDVFNMSYKADRTFTTDVRLMSVDGRTVYNQVHTFTP